MHLETERMESNVFSKVKYMIVKEKLIYQFHINVMRNLKFCSCHQEVQEDTGKYFQISMLIIKGEYLVRNTTNSEQMVYSVIETTCFCLYRPSSGFYNSLRAVYICCKHCAGLLI